MWGAFAMDRLCDIKWSKEAFNSLVLGSRQKDLILALFEQHATRAKVFDDVVKDKGKGLVGLLSGRPGCGKTLTAEAMAEITESPLYTVSAGELGTEPMELDECLSRILELAQTWKAVLLIDEAEVFLQTRSCTDVNRNALVSIFLRQLEYYQGILILTTNLAAQCDSAFESRIHFCIHYPDLDFDSRREIWSTFLKKASDSGFSDRDLDRLASHEMNGRQIKNAVSSALCIALKEKSPPSLSIEHIQSVLEVISDWNKAKSPAPSTAGSSVVLVDVFD